MVRRGASMAKGSAPPPVEPVALKHRQSACQSHGAPKGPVTSSYSDTRWALRAFALFLIHGNATSVLAGSAGSARRKAGKDEARPGARANWGDGEARRAATEEAGEIGAKAATAALALPFGSRPSVGARHFCRRQ